MQHASTVLTYPGSSKTFFFHISVFMDQSEVSALPAGGMNQSEVSALPAGCMNQSEVSALPCRVYMSQSEVSALPAGCI